MFVAEKSPLTDAGMIEREIIAQLRAAKLRLRFDKVALRLVGRLKAVLASIVPEGETVVFTITSPIRLPGKTALALENMAPGPPDAERREIIHDNEVRIRRLREVPKHMPKVLGFVHNAESDAGVILALVEERLREPNRDA
jgi:hypothetical protein